MRKPLTPFGARIKAIGLARSELANRLNVSVAAVGNWANGTGRCSAENAVAVEIATSGQIPRHLLRPDLFHAGGLGENPSPIEHNLSSDGRGRR
jgi:hypothetical protein